MFNIDEANISLHIDTIDIKQYKITYSILGNISPEDLIKHFSKFDWVIKPTINGVIEYKLDTFEFPVIFDLIHIDKLGIKIKENYLEIGISPDLISVDH